MAARGVWLSATSCVAALVAACADGEGLPVLTADMPLHLEDHLDAAVVDGSEVPALVTAPVEWRFDEPQPEWTPVWNPPLGMPGLEPTGEGLRVTLTEQVRTPAGRLAGSIRVSLPDWDLEDWDAVVIRARADSTTSVTEIGLGFNPREGRGTGTVPRPPFETPGPTVRVVRDGTVQTYRLSVGDVTLRGPWRELGLHSLSDGEPGSIDFLSVSVVPKEAVYAAASVGTGFEVRDTVYRRLLYSHAPGRLEYRVRVPGGGRLDFAPTVLRAEAPVTFRVTATVDAGERAVLYSEASAEKEHWTSRSVDLSHLAGRTVSLALEADARDAGAVALWGTPTLSGIRTSEKPNIVFYVIDGGSADYMSVYGYNRRTTPNLERLAAEGALFERAYSNASWTRPSTASFLTSLYHSVFGGLANGANPVPKQVATIAEHLHRAGYQTAELTSNPNAGRVSNLDRGNDAFRDVGVRPNHSISSIALHENFWQWRAAYPAEPYWVHFQTTDVHSDHYPVPPFAGLFISSDRREVLDEWDERLRLARQAGADFHPESFEQAGVDRVDYFTALRDLHDETMAHQDYQLGQLVARLKAQGEWERTLLIVAADHGVWAGAEDYGALMLDSLPPYMWFDGFDAPIFAPGISRIPMIFVWPGRIAPGQRVSDAVSMIDMLPTVLDLVDLPLPDVMQGQSLAPLLLGESGWEPRPVIFDEFQLDAETRELRGRIDVVDGRWAASLEINFDPERPEEEKRPAPLLLYDLWTDPMCLHSLHESRPDLVEKYTKFLQEQFDAHLALGRHLTPSEAPPLTPEQVETLRTLGYIR